MKTKSLLFAFLIFSAINGFSQQRYLNEVFNGVNITSNVVYGENYSVLTGTPILQTLMMDVYEPAGDTASARPVVIYMHAGDFLPLLFANPIGDVHDSSVVEICKRFARRGFVAVSMDYRLGWLPGSLDQDIRTGTLIQAVYRGLQDAKSCVRYLRMNATTQGNTYKIDTNCIAIGGEGSAGYISTAYATLNDSTELQLLKFLSTTNGQPYIQPYILGSIDGFGGDPTLNNENWPGYSSKVCMVFNLEGALGDSSWLEAGEVPMVSFHDTNNPGAPYYNGPVIGPVGFVVWATGSHDMIRDANLLGNNDVFNVAWNDPYTARADQENDGWEGLFPIVQPDPGPPYNGQSNPWQWWDSLDLQSVAPLYGISSFQASQIYLAGFFTNPDMSKSKAMRYIDTVMGYLAPRIVQNCQLPGFISGVGEVNLIGNDVKMFPNPAEEYFILQLADASQQMKRLQLFDATGRLVKEISSINSNHVQMNRSDLVSGLYLLKIQLTDRELNGKLIIP